MRKFVINVNGNSYEVDVEEVKGGVQPQRQSAPVARPTAPVSTVAATPTPAIVNKEVVVSAGQEIIESPMPGNIWKIEVTEGQMVKAGDTLLILEAMKMENEILAPRDGKVISIATTTGASVNTGDKLVIIE